MDSNSSNASAAATEGYAPVDGSWVAELEDAEVALATVLVRSPDGGGGAASQRQRRGELLQLYMRLCRAYSMLRQWEMLQKTAAKGLNVCASYGAAPSSGSGASTLLEWQARFESFREQARREVSVPSSLNEPSFREHLQCIVTGEAEPDTYFVASAAVTGDLRLMEAAVAHGCATDVPFAANLDPDDALSQLPTDASVLVTLCADLAGFDSKTTVFNPRLSTNYLRGLGATLHRTTECAMQLVRLGADPTRKLNLCNAPDWEQTRGYRAAGFDGKTALELAKISKRTELVELMERHLRLTPEERAEIVHCRCGSRLPWKACHATGIGQPPHYLVGDEFGVAYRVSPCARCPCRNTTLTHYKCCWKDTSTPVYLRDATGTHLRRFYNKRPLGEFDPVVTPMYVGETADVLVANYASLLRSDPDALKKAFAGDGQKSRVASWDPEVYAGCLEHYENKDDFFVWTDLHWKLDKSELLHRAQKWNKALKKYCRSAGLVGEERDRVIAQHTANPCAPCGRIGCSVVEKEPKEFRRCSRCKLIAYCGSKCQKKDWSEHRKNCGGL